mgnify:CR=1 FL=1
MREHIKEVLSKVANTNHFELIIKELSFEERNYFIEERKDIMEALDEEVRERLNIDENSKLFMSSIYTEKEAINLLESTEIGDEFKKILSILALSTDKLKIHYLDKLTSENDKAWIIENFETDELKIQGLDKLTYDFDRSEIIENFGTDALKIQGLEKLTDDSWKAGVISSFGTDALKILYLDKLEQDFDKAEVISSFETDELKIQALDKLESDYYRFDIISSFGTVASKIQALDKLEYDYYKTQVISSFETNALKILNLDKLTDDSSKAEVISGFGTDELKIQNLDKLTDDSSKAEVISSFETDELKIQYLDKLTDDSSKAEVISSFETDELKIQYLDKLADEFPKVKVISSFKADELILSSLIELGDKNVEKYRKIKDNCKIKYKDSLSLVLSGNEKFKKIINDEEIFSKFITLFNVSNAVLNKKQIDTVLETVLPKEFQQNNRKIWEISSRLKGMSERGEEENITQELFDIIKYCQNTQNLVGKELEQFITDIQNDSNYLKNFIIELVDQSKSKVREGALERLKVITSQYINVRMEDYKIARKKQIFANNLLGIDRKVDRNYLLKYITEHYNTNTLSNLILKFYPEQLTSNTFTNGITLKDVLEWKTKDPKNAPKEIKLGFKGLNKILAQLYDEHYDELFSMLKVPSSEIKYDERLEIDNSANLAKLLLTCNLDGFFELCLKENHEKYVKIMDVIKKYHLIGLGSNFNRIFEMNDMSNFDMKNFIEKIFPIATALQKKKKINLKVVLEACSLDENLVQLLGKDNAELLANNPPPNSASAKRTERLDKIPRYMRDMYEREFINVPPIKEDISLENGKSLSVNLGNFTNAINLTYGERTGACMRILGVGQRLLDFCLRNTAGFHIRFSSKKGEFVSRVSGFRVGNTVFLNELRNSVSSEFTDEDVRLACQNVANRLIELSKDSESPIENVVVANQYVFRFDKPTVNLGVNFVKDGEKTPGYFDVNPNKCVLLATSNQDNSREYVPFKDTKMPEYRVLRDDVKYLDHPEAIQNEIARIKGINDILQGKSYDEVVFEDESTEYMCAYVGEDFYVAVDKDGNIDTYIMPNTKKRKQAEIEVKEVLDKLKNLAINAQDEKDIIVSGYTESHSEIPPSVGGRRHGSKGQVTFSFLMIVSLILSIATMIILLYH